MVQTQPLYLILSVNGSSVTGSAGPDEHSQNAIRNGQVTEDQILFQVGAVSLRLHLNGALLEGVGSRADDASITATISATRVSDNTLEDRLPPLVYEGSERSPRMLALRDAVQTKGPAVVEDFWKAVTASGAPLIEPISGNDLREFLASAAVRDLLEAHPRAERSEVRRRALDSLVPGCVLSCVGLVFVVTGRDAVRFFGTVGLTIGVGFLLAAFLSRQEIARMTGYRVGSVRPSLSHARRRLAAPIRTLMRPA